MGLHVGIYSPYLDTSGGGERYMLTIAEILSRSNEVDVILDSHLQKLNVKEIIEKNSNLLDLDLSKVNLATAPIGKGGNFFQRLVFLKNYDVLFCLTDGSIFYSTAKKNILHIQSPIKVSNQNIWKKIKSSSWDLIIYNSQFTKYFCEKYWNVKGEVIYPPVNVEGFKSSKKKKQILTVGRFFEFSKAKKHELMIKSFKNLIDSKKIFGWSFYLAGGADEGNKEYIEQLRALAIDYPIYILPNIIYPDLKKLYSQSSIYWHASGFGETDPAKMEHFGITTVEAMASGCVPVVVNLGGQKEIVEENVNGFLWDNPQDLEIKTLKLISNNRLMESLSKSAIESSAKFSKEEFAGKIKKILK